MYVPSVKVLPLTVASALGVSTKLPSEVSKSLSSMPVDSLEKLARKLAMSLASVTVPLTAGLLVMPSALLEPVSSTSADAIAGGTVSGGTWLLASSISCCPRGVFRHSLAGLMTVESSGAFPFAPITVKIRSL